MELNIGEIIKQIKSHSEYSKVGMVLYHNGVVRGTSRDGSKVSGLRVKVDYPLLDKIIKKYKSRDGIIEIIVEIIDDVDLLVGDDVMCIGVAGDIRENVIATLTDTLNSVKNEVVKKTEFFV